MITNQHIAEERKTVNLLGVAIDAVDTKELCHRVIEFTGQESTRTIMYVNTDCMLIAQEDDDYRKILNRSDLVYADGIGVVYGVKLWGQYLPGRSTAADFMPVFCRLFAEKGLRLYLLGAPDGVAEKAAAKLHQEIPELLISGTHHGFFSPDQNDEIIARINAASPDIVLVGMGAPYQEVWISENADKIHSAVIWGVGGLFDFLSGRTPRGSKWLVDHGFEWLCRLTVEPKRLWQRYLIGNTKFIASLLWHRCKGE